MDRGCCECFKFFEQQESGTQDKVFGMAITLNKRPKTLLENN